MIRHTCIPTIIQVIDGSLSLCFPFITRIYIANEVITNVVTHLDKVRDSQWRDMKGFTWSSSK